MASLCNSGVVVPISYTSYPLLDFTQNLTFQSGSACTPSYTTPSFPISIWELWTCGTFWGIPTCWNTGIERIGTIPGIQIWPGLCVSMGAQAQIKYVATTSFALSTNGSNLMPVPMFIQELSFTGMSISLNIADIEIDTSNLADTNLYSVNIIQVEAPAGILQEITVSLPSVNINEIPDVDLIITMSFAICPGEQFALIFAFVFSINIAGYTFSQTANIIVNLDDLALE
jgi:hypothetical protein